jgi:hypothetical protein
VTTDRNPQLLASHSSRLTVQSARPKLPRGDAPIPHRIASRLPPRHAPSTPPRHAMPRPSSRQGAADIVIPHKEVLSAVDASAATTLDITRFGLARPGAGFSGCTSRFLPSSNVTSACCKRMLQMFYVDVAKVDRDVAYVTMAIHVCCKCLFQLFQLFQTDVARVLSGCYICFTLMFFDNNVSHLCCDCFIPMLHMFSHICCKCFRLDVTYVLQWLHTCFPRVLDVYCKCFNCFECMLQMLPIDVAKVDLLLHILQWTPSAAAARPACIHVGVEGARAATRETVRVQIEMERA